MRAIRALQVALVRAAARIVCAVAVLVIGGTPPSSYAADPLPNDVQWDGLRHDSRDTLYRTPGGAVPAGTAVRLRLRTFHDDVTGVALRVYDVNAGAQQLTPMARAASDVSCQQPGLDGFTCDFWEATVTSSSPNNLWYRFVVSDGVDTDYYADDTPALDGGVGAPSDEVVDDSFALMFYDPAFSTPAWPSSAIVYQVMPDRFRSGRLNNDPRTGDLRYDDPVLALPWGTLPEGYCRNYADADTGCPWRFDTSPPAWSPLREGPRGRDYFGGDLKGLDQSLEYLQALGVTAVYLNPIFDAASNHGYDTQDYLKIDPYFGSAKDWQNLVKHAGQLGLRLVLDGVFNHLSSDSAFFDRYGHYATAGACEAAVSPYRGWFDFRPPAAGEPAACAPSTPGGGDTYYTGWFGFDSIPVLRKANPAVQQYFVTSPGSVARHWLKQGASAWRLDVMGDASFPEGYWETFRSVVKGTKSDAFIVGELWQKDTTLLRALRGDRADAATNYRLRDAVVGLLAPGSFDSKGFADSGRPISPSEFVSRLESIREDYPAPVYRSLMNLLDSHDTERVLWTLTPGTELQAEKELDGANLAAGKRRVQLASLIQFFVPGAPTIYYGDEVGVTGDDDPDNRRTYPWADLGGAPDLAMLDHYRSLALVRRSSSALTAGDFRGLLADDAAGTVALGRKASTQAAILALNLGDAPRTLAIPVTGFVPDGLVLTSAHAVGSTAGGAFTVAGGALAVTLPPWSGLLLVSGETDLKPPDPPTGLRVTAEASGQVSLAWNAAMGAESYNVYRSVLRGGGYVRANAAPASAAEFTDLGLANAQHLYYVVTALDAAGNESGPSNEVAAMPHSPIGWANLQWPPSISHVISATTPTDRVYGQVWIDGATSQPGATPGLTAQLGFGPSGTSPDGNAAWAWVDAVFNVDAGNNDEFMASLLPSSVGAFDYAYRYSTTGGRDWLYADLDGAGNGYDPASAGKLTVSPSDDATPPATPVNLRVTARSATRVSLAWDPIVGDPSLYGYEVLRGTTSGGPRALLATIASAEYADPTVSEGATYYYVVRALDASFNRSGDSGEVSATAESRKVVVQLRVTVPGTTAGTGRSVYVAGTLARLDGGLPDWTPDAAVLSPDGGTWSLSLTGDEGVQLQYKYTLGTWGYVEKDGSCGELNNRELTLSYGTTGTQVVDDTVQNWRNVSPCGD